MDCCACIQGNPGVVLGDPHGCLAAPPAPLPHSGVKSGRRRGKLARRGPGPVACAPMGTGRAWFFFTATILLTLSGARVEEPGRGDKLPVLYSNQFAFNRAGVPLISVRIAEGLREAVVESSAPVRVAGCRSVRRTKCT